ncbi:FAD-dependent monooxygenase, partial [Legionella sp.]|uniref:FAD-dependent monooxygenase n=1 Tax=Legionella sp. TaxID=459 RepID=UPI003CA88A9B
TKLGISVRIIDKEKQAGLTSRALVVQTRTLEFYNQIGITNEVVAGGIKLEYFQLCQNDLLLKTVNVTEIGVGMTPYPFILSFPQDDHERLLVTHLEKLGVKVERNTTLVSFSQTKEKVTAIIDCHNKQEIAKFDYLCGCDGARSTTREQVGLKFPGGTYSQKFFVADVESPDEAMRGLRIDVTETDFCLAFPVHSSKTVRLIGIVPPKHALKEEIKFADVQESVAKNIDIKITGVNWFSTYHVHHRVVSQFRVGRVFLSGDAAHIHSPVGGQGMNTGIGDAINLSWKLAAVLQKKCSEKILDTYELERLPFAKKLVSTTDKMFQIVTSSSFLGSAWRKFIFPYLIPMMFKYPTLKHYFFSFVSQIKIKYRASPLSMKNRGKVQGGDRLPWVSYKTTDNFEVLKTLDWQVHVYGKPNELLHETLQSQNISLIVFTWSKAAKDKGLIENIAYLIRPDGYISVIDSTPNGEHIKKMWISLK